MLAALIYGKEDLRLEEVPFPTPDAGEIAIKVRIAVAKVKSQKSKVKSEMLTMNGF